MYINVSDASFQVSETTKGTYLLIVEPVLYINPYQSTLIHIKGTPFLHLQKNVFLLKRHLLSLVYTPGK